MEQMRFFPELNKTQYPMPKYDLIVSRKKDHGVLSMWRWDLCLRGRVFIAGGASFPTAADAYKAGRLQCGLLMRK